MKTEACLSLDVNRLTCGGVLRPGTSCRLSWALRYGGESQCLTVCRSRSALLLGYRQGKYVHEINVEGSGFDQELYEVPLTWTPCNYGGERPWFLCPNIHCRRRVGKLFLGGRYFLCRHCYRLKYESQSEGPHNRALRALQRVVRRLDPSATSLGLPARPKGMHWATYVGFGERYDAADELAWATLKF